MLELHNKTLGSTLLGFHFSTSSTNKIHNHCINIYTYFTVIYNEQCKERKNCSCFQ